MNNLPKLNTVNSKVINFTTDQAIAVQGLNDFIKSPYNEKDYKRALSGAAGTGKTFVLKHVIDNSGFSSSTIGLAAPTHKACRVLKDATGIIAKTVQSDLGLRLNFDVDNFDINNPPFDPKGQIAIQNYRLYIVDEASMINRDLLFLIEKECKKAKCKLILVGDESQLSPVKETYSPAFRGVKTFFLNEIVRQSSDNPIADLLKMLRKDIKHNTFNFLNYIVRNTYNFNEDGTKGYVTLNPNDFTKAVIKGFTNEAYQTNVDMCKTICYTNNCVNGWNRFIRNTIVKDADKSIITNNDLITSYVTIVDEFNDIVIKNSEDYIIKDVVNYTNDTYEVDGFLVRFIAVHGGKSTTPLFILDHTNRNSLLQYYKVFNRLKENALAAKGSARGSAWKSFYNFKESVLLLGNITDNMGKIIIPRDLDYGFSITSHKSQGSTYDDVYVEINDIVLDSLGNVYPNAEEINRRLYVACSRARNRLFFCYGKPL